MLWISWKKFQLFVLNIYVDRYSSLFTCSNFYYQKIYYCESKKKKNFTTVTNFQKFIFLYPRNPSRISTRYPYHARALVSSVRRKVASTASLMAKYGSPATFTSLLPFFSFQVLGHRVQILATHESRVEERFPPTLIFQTIALFLLRRRARRIVSRNLG